MQNRQDTAKNKWIGAVYVMMVYLYLSNVLSNMFSGGGGTTSFFVVGLLWSIYIVAGAMIAVSIINPARHRLGVAGTWMLAVLAALEILANMLTNIIITVRGMSSWVMLFGAASLLLFAVALVMWAIFITRATAFRKISNAVFTPAILMIAAMLLGFFALLPRIVIFDDYSRHYLDAYNGFRTIMHRSFCMLSLMFFAALWMKEVGKEQSNVSKRNIPKNVQMPYSLPGYDQQSYAAPQQQYVAPQQQYAAPQQQYTAPQQQYAAPQQQYTAPQQPARPTKEQLLSELDRQRDSLLISQPEYEQKRTEILYS